MFDASLKEEVLKIVEEAGPVSVREIMEALSYDYRNPRERETLHSLLYGELHDLVIRDKNEDGMPTWRLKNKTFEAAKGLEILFYSKLLQEGVIDETTASLDTKIDNKRRGKTYHIDIAIDQNGQKFAIEIDGYEHIRADALASIQNQIDEKGQDNQIEIDWMDNESSYVSYSKINRPKVYKWLSQHPSWCIRYHEELLWPHDITRNVWLIDNGWRIIRFWNFEIQNELTRCISELKEVIEK